MFAEQLAVVPPLDPVQLHVQGPVPLTVVGVPELQRLVVGAEVKVPPFDAPHTPFTGVDVKEADIVWFAATLLNV